jgi:hypothetical protein
MRYDRIKEPTDLAPDESLRIEGKVVDQDGVPVESVAVLLVPPVDESISYKSYDIALVEGRVRNQLEHVMTYSDVAGRFVIYPPKDEPYYVIALHHDSGFSLTGDEGFIEDQQLRLLKWASLTSGFSKEPEEQEASLRTRIAEAGGRPEIVFNQYWSDLKNKGPTLVFSFTHVPPIFDTMISRSFAQGEGTSISLPGASVSLLPGESRRLDLGPLSEQQRLQLDNHRRTLGNDKSSSVPKNSATRDN